MELNHYPRAFYESGQMTIFDHFTHYNSGDLWTSLAADTTATVAATSAAGGILAVFTDATNNNEAAVVTTNELFKFAAGKPFRAGCRLQYTEVTGNGANVFFGFADAIAANMLADDGGGISSKNSAAGIYKIDGGTVWKTHAINSSDSESTDSLTTAGGSSYQVLEIFGRAIDGQIAEYEITYAVDHEPLRDSNNKVIVHKISYASATEMDFGVYAKTGAAAALTVNVDWIGATILI